MSDMKRQGSKGKKGGRHMHKKYRRDTSHSFLLNSGLTVIILGKYNLLLETIVF